MKILLTGADGQLAQEIQKITKQKSHTLEALGRKDMDISDLGAVSLRVRKAKPDFIINCAAYNDVDGAEDNWQSAYKANALGVKNLALVAKDNGAVLVHFSTDYVFSGGTKSPYTIAEVPDPISSYGQSKLAGEEMLSTHGKDYFLIRTSWVFGHGEFSFPKKVIQWSQNNSTLNIVDDQVACPTFGHDLAEATLKLIETKKFGLYHITNSGHCSRFEWAEFILKSINWSGTLNRAKSSDFNTKAERPKYSVLDNFPLRQAIGYQMSGWQDATERFLKEIG